MLYTGQAIPVLQIVSQVSVSWKTSTLERQIGRYTSSKDDDMLCNSDGLQLIDITRDHKMEQLITLSIRGDKTLDLIFTYSPGIANNCYSKDIPVQLE